MVRTRKKDYTEEVMQPEHQQTAQPTRGETVGKAGTPKADHIGRRNSSMVFSSFQQLPCELRLMVWKAAMTPRLVAVIPRPRSKSHDEARNRKKREISLIRGIPALLAVNQESRYLALRHYTWRFTINITIATTGRRWVGHEHRRARVVMSPDDTLGLFRCESLWGVWISRFDVKVANDKASPWRTHESTDAPHRGFKKVAILGDAVKSNLHIVRALNVTLWDLDSILHAESAEMRTAHSPHTRNKILVESARMTTRFPILVGWFLQDIYRRVLERNGQSLDVLAYKLAEGDKGAEDWENFLRMLSKPPLAARYYS